MHQNACKCWLKCMVEIFDKVFPPNCFNSNIPFTTVMIVLPKFACIKWLVKEMTERSDIENGYSGEEKQVFGRSQQ